MSNETFVGSRRLAVYLFAGLLLAFLAVWKGDGGYRDLREYLDNAERLWLKGDLSEPRGPGESADAPPRYNRFSLGLPILSAPLVYLGALAERLTDGAVPRRMVAALIVPLLGALAGVLVYLLGRIWNQSHAACLWAAVIFTLGSPLLSYTRLYYAEVGLLAMLLLAWWLFLRAQRDAAGTGAMGVLLTGMALACAALCHYANVLLCAGVGCGMTVALLLEKPRPVAQRLLRAGLLSLMPLLALAGLLALNAARYGHPLRTGYHEYHEKQAAAVFALQYLWPNLEFAVGFLLRVPWLLPALGLGLAGLRHAGALWALYFGLAAGAMLQWCFWLSFSCLSIFWLRYQVPLLIAAVPGLLALAVALEGRWKIRGLVYGGLALAAWNLAGLLRGDDGSQPLFWAPDGALHAYVWYMRPFEIGMPEALGTPVSIFQFIMFLALALAGCAVLFMAMRLARQADAAAEIPART